MTQRIIAAADIQTALGFMPLDYVAAAPIVITAGTISLSGGGGTGTVTSIATGSGLTGGPISTAGTISLAPVSAGCLVGNPGTASAAPGTVSIGTGLSLSAGGALSLNQAGTATLGGVVVGAGLAVSAGTISNGGLLSIDGTTGAVVLGANLVLNAGTLAVTGITSGIPDAPADGHLYVRANGGWSQITIPAVGVTSIGGTAGSIALGSNLTINSGTLASSAGAPAIDATLVTNSGTIGVDVGHANAWTKAQRATPAALTNSGGTIAVDMALSNNFYITLAASGTMQLPTNIVAGQAGIIAITQAGSGSNTLVWNSVFKWVGGAPATLSTAAGALDLVSYYVADTTHIALSPGINCA